MWNGNSFSFFSGKKIYRDRFLICHAPSCATTMAGRILPALSLPMRMSFPFKDSSFGHIVFLSVIPHFDNRAQVFRESHRILKSAGSLSVVHFLPAARINEIHSKVGGPIAHDYLPDIKELGRTISENGFRVEEISADDCYFLFARKCRQDQTFS